MAAVDDEIMALRLAQERSIDRRVDELVAFRCAQRRAQVGGILLAETHIERTGAGEAHAIARLAEVMRERGNEAEPPTSLGNVYVARRSARAVVDILHAVALGQPRAHHRRRATLL